MSSPTWRNGKRVWPTTRPRRWERLWSSWTGPLRSVDFENATWETWSVTPWYAFIVTGEFIDSLRLGASQILLTWECSLLSVKVPVKWKSLLKCDNSLRWDNEGKKKKSCWTVFLSLFSWKLNHLALSGELTSEGRASQINELPPNYSASFSDVCGSCFPAARLGLDWWLLLASSVDNGRIRCQAASSDKDLMENIRRPFHMWQHILYLGGIPTETICTPLGVQVLCWNLHSCNQGWPQTRVRTRLNKSTFENARN